jgi:hypothetical protein
MLHEILANIHYVVWLLYHTLGMLYQSILLIGALGLILQGVLGLGHHGGATAQHGASAAHAGGSAAGHAGHAGAGASAPAHAAPAHAAPAPASTQTGSAAAGHHATSPAGAAASGRAGRGGSGQTGQKISGALWTLFSPLTIFSFCLGVGATGLLLGHLLSEWETAIAALVGGVVFYTAIVKPLWRLIFMFASKPAETLAGTVAREATAMSQFDARGRGVVRLTVDGQVIRVLAHLDRADREKGIKITPGDTLVVTNVDGAHNSCTVARL